MRLAVRCLTAALALAMAAEPVARRVRHTLATEALDANPDDPAIWVNPANAGESLILGTKKVAAPQGALVVFGLDGRVRQTFGNVDRPNNVDVEGDLAVLTERNRQSLRSFRVSAAGVRDLGRVRIFEGQTGDQALPMGIGLYKRPRDGALFAIVSRKNGPSGGYLWQYRLQDRGARVEATKVREFGAYSGGAGNEIEAVAVDDAPGFVYYADEAGGIRKYHADPDHKDAARELAWFGRGGFAGNREGIAIYARPDGSGWIICTDQLPGNSRYHLFPRQGTQSNATAAHVIAGGADSTDGIEATSQPLGPRFPRGLVVAMNSASRNFLVYEAGAFLGPGASASRASLLY